jgi:hypothetical protein
MDKELLQSAKEGNLDVVKQLINQALLQYNTSVKEIQLTEGVLSIKLRCLKGEIEPNLLLSVQQNAEKLKIKGVERVEVTEALKLNTPPPPLPQKQVRKIISKPPSLWSQPWIKGAGGLVLLVILAIPAAIFYQEQSICKISGGKPAYKELDSIVAEWDDAVTLAESTSRMALPSQISTMQAIKRDLDDIEWNECSSKAVDLLRNSMQATIEGFVLFLADEDESDIQEKWEASLSAQAAYGASYLDLLPPSEKMEKKREFYEGLAKDHLKSVRLAQYLHNLENSPLTSDVKNFTSDVEKLERFSSYRVAELEGHYNLQYSLSSPQFFTAIAASQDSKIKSYALAMTDYQWIICASVEPSKTIEMPIASGKSLSCGQESIQVEGKANPTE